MEENEKNLRRRLADNLGVEFFDLEDPEINEEVKSESIPDTPPSKAMVEGNIRRVSVSDLIQKCNLALAKLPDEDPNKALIWNCAFALRQLVDRLAKLEGSETVQ